MALLQADIKNELVLVFVTNVPGLTTQQIAAITSTMDKIATAVDNHIKRGKVDVNGTLTPVQ